MKIIAGKYRNRKLEAPEGKETRPTLSRVRETLFNIVQFEIENARFLDLFAGVGAIGLEALSRGASHSTFVENMEAAEKAIEKNIETLGEEEHTTLISLNVFDALQFFVEKEKTFDIIFADPPYGQGLGEKVLEFLDTHALLSPNGSFFLEDEGTPLYEPTKLSLKKSRKSGRAHLSHYISPSA